MSTMRVEPSAFGFHPQREDLRRMSQNENVRNKQEHSLTRDVWDYLRRVGATAAFAGWGLRTLQRQAANVRRGPFAFNGESADRERARPASSSTDERERVVVQAGQSQTVTSFAGLRRDPSGGYRLPRQPASANNPYGATLAQLIEQKARDPYVCGACKVQGVGDHCWYCGSRSITRNGVTSPVNPSSSSEV